MNKKVPYTVPEGYFETLEERLIKEMPTQKKSTNTRKIALWTSVAVAASLALLFVLRPLSKHTVNDSFAAVEEAFLSLDENDQELYFELYDEDIFINNY